MDSSAKTSWLDTLTRQMTATSQDDGRIEHLMTDRGRSLLVSKTRWVLLVLFCGYGLFAGSYFYLVHAGFRPSVMQLVLLGVTLLGVVAYNSMVSRCLASGKECCSLNRMQVFLDLLFVTLFIQCSGGAASWVWPIYLIVTIEAAFLLERKRDVWVIGIIGTTLYIGLLAGHYFAVIPYVSMPFISDELHHDPNYLLLMACWVSLLNATVALISSFLMSVIRRETDALRESEEQLVHFLDTANDFIFSVNPAGEFLYVNKAWQRTIGYSLNDLASRSIDSVIHPDSLAQCHDELARVLAGENGVTLEARLRTREGGVVTVEGNLTCAFKDGEPTALWGICRDVTERRMAQDQLYHLAHHDPLSGLPNRSLLIDRLTQAKAMAHRLKHHVAVLFLDLDRFKIINDTLGHEIGDQLIQAVASRLASCVRDTDTVARIGGDEFVTILVNIKSLADAEHITQKIVKTLAKPYFLDGHELFVTTSIGISLYPDDADAPDDLIKKADIAMYSAKGQGRNNFQFYAPEMDEHADRVLSLSTSMRKALEREEFSLCYQPKVDIGTGRITALEALLRWEHPELGQLPPSEFIPLAEETGMIIPLGEWVMRTACRQNREWQEQGLPPLRVAVNLSGYQLQQKNILDVVKGVLRDTGLKSEYLEFEVTETVIMQNPDFAISILAAFRELGIHISIDDFGTGYSSLAHLKRFSVNTLKIDKSFMRDVEISSTDAAIATAIISMGNSLNLKVIAEGVETTGQLSFLRENLCDEMQGYLFSKPLPSEAIADFLRANGDKQWLVNEDERSEP